MADVAPSTSVGTDVSTDVRSAQGTEPGTDPGSRGSLTVSDRVVQKVARAAAARVPGVVSTSSGMLGRDLPAASARTRGTRAQVEVDVAFAWPALASPTAQLVRDEVASAVARYAGVRTDRVDVRVVAVTDPTPTTLERVQ